jgi:hypothetical protein
MTTALTSLVDAGALAWMFLRGSAVILHIYGESSPGRKR